MGSLYDSVRGILDFDIFRGLFHLFLGWMTWTLDCPHLLMLELKHLVLINLAMVPMEAVKPQGLSKEE